MLFPRKKVDFLLVYDSWIREYESLQGLSRTLTDRGFSVKIIPNHWRRYKNALLYMPRVVLLPFMYNRLDGVYAIYKSLYPAACFVNIHSEQISNADTEILMLPQDDDAREVWHLVWSNDFKLKLEEVGVNPSKIYVTGNMRLDSLFSIRPKKKVKRNESRQLLYPSSFGMTIMSKDYIKNVEKSIEVSKLERQLLFMEQERKNSFKILYRIAERNTDLNIIIRPHPHVRVDLLEKTFYDDVEGKKLVNISFERKGSIKEFFEQEGRVLVWHSTTLLEAAILGKECAILSPSGFPSYLEMDYFKYFAQFSCYDEVRDWLDDTGVKENRAEEYLMSKFNFLDGLSTNRVANSLELLLDQNNEVKRFLQIKIIVKALVIDNMKSILRFTGMLYILFPYYKGIKEDI